MKPKLVIVLALIVLSPLAVVLWLGARVVRDEQLVVEHRVRQLMLAELRTVDEAIGRSVAEFERSVLAEMEPLTDDPEILRRRLRGSPLVRQYFVLDADGRMLHPPASDPPRLSSRERQALERTRRIWEAGALVRPASDGETDPRAAGAHGGSRIQWHTWYWDDGLQLMLWLREADRVHAAEVNRLRFLADVVAALPETDPLSSAVPEGRIRLADSKDATIYQWGPYDPPEGSLPVADIPLRAPLGAWSLQYYAPGEVLGTAVRGSALLNAIIGGLVLAGAIVAMTYYFYREQSRAMREAAQRVSFVNRVSHELKNPLTNIRMYAELLEGDLPEDDDRAKRHLQVVVTESQRLSRLIGNVLTFSRNQRHTLTLHRKPGAVDEVLRTTLDHYLPALKAKSIDVRFTAGAGKPVLLDADAVEQIVGNLINNAEKYAAAGGRLDVTSVQRDDTVTIHVADEGPGIPASERGKVFRPFYRVSDSLTEGVTGSGIGLSVARELARLHGGDLELLPSETGALFRLTLRCPPAQEGGEA